MIHTFNNPLTQEMIRDLNNTDTMLTIVNIAAIIAVLMFFPIIFNIKRDFFINTLFVVVFATIFAVFIFIPRDTVEYDRDENKIYSVAFPTQEEEKEFEESLSQWYSDNNITQEQFCGDDVSLTRDHAVDMYEVKDIDDLLQCGGKFSGLIEQEVERDGEKTKMIITSEITEEGIILKTYTGVGQG